MPIVEAAVALVVAKVLDHLANETIKASGTRSAKRVRGWLNRDPQKLAIQLALARTEARFASDYPEWHGSLFDKSFLGGPAAPILARSLTRSESVTAPLLADAWAKHVGGDTGQRYARDVAPAAEVLLGWWREEVGRFETFRAVLDSRSLDSISAATDRTVEAVHELRGQLTDALSQLDRVVLRARYPALEDHIDWPSRQAVQSPRMFVGREWVFDFLDDFSERNRSGYIRIVADAGLGKTALATEIAARRNAAAFFFSASAGRTQAHQCLNHLSAELIDAYDLPHDRLAEHSGQSSSYLSRLLNEAVQGGRPVWLVLDALDEAQSAGGPSVGLPLPDQLPSGTFVVLTQRSGTHSPAPLPGSGTALETLTISAGDRDQRLDVLAFLRDRVNRDNALKSALARARPRIQAVDFARLLATNSEGNFMYLAYVLDDLIADPTPSVTSDTLPRGLTDYYERMWSVIADQAVADWQQWEQLHLPVIEHLAVAGEPITLRWLGDHVGRPAAEIQRRALTAWQRFLQHSHDREHWRVIHQSFRDFLARTNEVDLPAVHRSIADRYLANAERWEDHSGYPSRHLSFHLREARDHNRLFELVENPAWREAQRRYDPSGATVLNDTRHAWAAASEVDAIAVAQGRVPPYILREITSALATAELYSVSDDLPPQLLKRLLEAHMWTPQHVVATASRISNPYDRAKALIELAPHLPDSQHAEALAHARTAVDSMTYPTLRTGWLAALADRLSDSQRADTLDDALQAALTITEPVDRAAELTHLVTLVGGEQRACALATALDTAREIADPYQRALGLTSILPQCSMNERSAVVADALGSASTISDVAARVHALERLAPELVDIQLHELLATSGTISAPEERARLLTALAAHLSEEQRVPALLDALSVAGTVSDVSQRAELLAALATHLPDCEVRAAVTETIAETADTPSRECVRALVVLAPHLLGEDLRTALATARKLPDPDSRAVVLTVLSHQFQEPERADVLTEALAAVALVNKQHDVVELLNELAPHLHSTQIDDALAIVNMLSMGHDRGRVLAALAPHLPEHRLQDALGVAVGHTGANDRVSALVALAPVLPDEARTDALHDALQAVESIPRAALRARALTRIAPHLSAAECEHALTRAFTAMNSVTDPIRRARGLAELVPSLQRDKRPRALAHALTAAHAIADHAERAHALIKLVPLLRELPEREHVDALTAAFATASAMTDVSASLRLIAALAPEFPERATKTRIRAAAAINAGLKAAEAITDPNQRGSEFAWLVPRLSGHQRDEAVGHVLDAAAATTYAHERFYMLNAVAQHLSGGDQRSRAIEIARAYGDPSEGVQALMVLLPHLRDDYARRANDEALTAAAEITLPATRSQMLVALVPHLPERQARQAIADALTAAAEITAPAERSQMLIALVPHLSEDQAQQAISDALTAAMAVDDPGHRVRALISLAPLVPRDQCLQVVMNARQAALAVNGPEQRGRHLGDVASLALLSDDPDASALHDVWDETLRAAAQGGTWAFAEAAAGLSPLLRQIVAAGS